MKMNTRMESNFTAMWVNFFTAAGIPSDVSATYALTFTENRIQNDMLLDLNKEYLRDMGITRMGDVIAILRHAKQVHENAARDKVLSTTVATVTNKVPVAAITGRSTVSQPSSPASRILEHYTRNPQVQEALPSQVLKRKPVDTGNNIDLSSKKARMIRFTSPPKPVVKEGTSNLTVFSRLGNEGSKVVQTKLTTSKVISKPIFSRLGMKTEPKTGEQIIPIDKDALKYEGILKSPPLSKKMVTITTTKNIRKISCTMRADEEPLSIKDKLALPKAKSVKFSNHIQYKEIEPIKKVQVNIKDNKSKAASFFNKPERRLSLPAAQPSVNNINTVKSRLGTKNVNNLTITSTVFKRLGV